MINGDIVIEISGGAPDQPVGRSLIIDGKILEKAKNPLICSNFCRQIRIHPDQDPKFVNFSLHFQYHDGKFNRFQTQSTNIRNLNFNDFSEEILIPLPPLVEQQLIVAHIETLLAHVNSASDQLIRVPSIMKKFRQAVLEAACSGKLTEGWRDEKLGGNRIESVDQSGYSSLLPYNLDVMGELPKGWTSNSLDKSANCRLGKMLDKIKNQGKLTPYIRNINVRWFGFDLSNIKEIKIEDHEKDTYSIRSGDVLICEGGEPGRCAIWNRNENEFIFQKALHRVRVGNSLLPEFLCFCLKDAADSGYLSNLFTGTTIKHLTGISLKKFVIPLPPPTEQHEIVRRVGTLFERADAIEREVAAATKRTEELTQAILGKAFRGELVSTDKGFVRNK